MSTQPETERRSRRGLLVGVCVLATCACAPPSRPADVSVVAHVASASISWAANPAAERVNSYSIFSAGVPFQRWGPDLAGAARRDAVPCCAADWAELQPGTKVYFAVAAGNAAGLGQASVPIAVTPFSLEVSWETRANMPTPRFDLGAAVVNGVLYAIGGDSGSLLSTNEAYDPAADRWTPRARMPTARAGPAVVAVNGKVYAISGRSSTDPNLDLSMVTEEYDPATDTWTARAPAPRPTYRSCNQAAGAVANGKIYLWPGQCSSPPNATLLEYDPASNTWANKSAVPWGISYAHQMTSVGNRIFHLQIGESSSLGSGVAEYSAGADVWTVKPSLKETEQLGNFPSWVGLAGSGRTLFGLGVQDRSGDRNWKSRVMHFDDAANAWSETSPMSKPRSHFATASAGSQIFVVGGAEPVGPFGGSLIPVTTLEVGVEGSP